MSFTSTVLAAAARLGLPCGAGAVAALSAGAATASCASSCVDIFSRGYGTHRHAAFVLDVQGKAARIGQPVIMFRASRGDPAEDFTIAFRGRVSDFASAGLMSPALALHYGGGCEIFKADARTCTKHFPDDFAYMIEYAPYGVGSGRCVGPAHAARRDTPRSLQPSGAAAHALGAD